MKHTATKHPSQPNRPRHRSRHEKLPAQKLLSVPGHAPIARGLLPGMKAAPITVVCFKWRRTAKGFQLPSVCEYTPAHVQRLKTMVARHLHIPHRFVCITDDAAGLDDVETVPLWDKCRQRGGCYNRLYVFSGDMKRLLGPRVLCIDLDCVIVNDITPLALRTEPFVINSYKSSFDVAACENQCYNGGLILMDTGSMTHLWDDFVPSIHPQMLRQLPYVVGSDQAWIRFKLGKGRPTFTESDGVYEILQVARNESLPANARIVFFAGPRDPSLHQCPWVQEHYLAIPLPEASEEPSAFHDPRM